MKVSVIIPTYRPQDYLWDCLSSLKEQTMNKDDFEVIIVLNGCCEPYKSSIERWISSNSLPNFILFQTDIAGVSNARNLALDNARGLYITFIDDDDYVSPTYIEELYNNASADVVALCYPLSFIDGTKDFCPYYITQDYLKNHTQSPCSYKKARRFFSGSVYKLIDKNIIGNRRFNCSFKNGEDSIFMFEISDRFKDVSFSGPNAVYYRRIRNGSALLRKKSVREVLKNCVRMIIAYSKIYFRHPFRYSFGFFITRVLGAIHGAMEQFSFRRVS